MRMSPSEDPFRTHLFTYRHDGAEWVLSIKATDATDARARIGKLAYATYNGVAVARMPAVLSPIGKASVGLRNVAMSIISRFV